MQLAAAPLPSSYPVHPDRVPPGVFLDGAYALRFGRCDEDLDAVQRLRFEVFSEEAGERDFEEEGRDADPFDPTFHHLLVFERRSGRLVGTYRLQTAEMASTAIGFYSATELDLSPLPAEILAQGVETGRACVAREHRNGRVLRALWRGIATYLRHNDKRYLFGCCSLPTTEAEVALRTWASLLSDGAFHPSLRAIPRVPLLAEVPAPGAPVPYPPLLKGYLSLGARVCSAPVLDADFGTIDFFIVLDVHDVEPRVVARLSDSSLWSAQ